MILELVVVFSLINSIQCVCQGTQAIIDALSTIQDAIVELDRRTEGVEETVHSILLCVVTGKDCEEIRDKGATTSGVYTINPDGGEPFEVYCDMDADKGGWTVFQRRKDGSEDFYRNWDDYVEGFGDLKGEFWLGLEKMYRLSAAGITTLRVDLEDFEAERRYAKYSGFAVAASDRKYQVYVGGYSGDAGHAMFNGRFFTTKDSDNDNRDDANCAVLSEGAWWYHYCDDSGNLNGLYLSGNHSSYANGVNWSPFRGYHYSLAVSEMKVRRNFHG